MNQNRKQEKIYISKSSNGKFKLFQGIILLTVIYTFIAAIVVFSALGYIDSHVVEETSSQLSDKTILNAMQKFTGVPKQLSYLSFSNNGEYCVYLYNGILYVKEITNGVKKIAEKLPISNVILMANQNIIIYFTIDNNGTIQIKTYNIDNSKTTLQKTFRTYAGAKIKQVDYSNLTNLIFLNVERKNIRGLSDNIYYLNIMKKVKVKSTGNIIKTMVLLSKSNNLYYQDKNNVLFNQSKPVAALKNIPVELLGKDSDDNVYVQSINDKSSVFVLNNDTIEKKIHLENTNIKKIIYNHQGIYVLYTDYMVDLTDKSNKKISINNGMNFIDLINGNLYLQDANGDIFSKNIF
jgi:uncharacterized protein with HEPN domain